VSNPAIQASTTNHIAREHTEVALLSALVTALPEFELNSPELLYAIFDPDCDGTRVSLNSQGSGYLFTPDQADDFADKVIVWGRTVKAMAGAARRHTEAADENSPGIGLDRLTAALPAAVDEAMRKTLPDQYAPELAAAIAQTMTGILTAALCPIWPGLCTDTTPGHYDHHNHDHEVTDKRGGQILDVGFVQLSDERGDSPAFICIGGEDYDPSEVRAKTAELRRLLDQADDMADQVMRMQGAAVQPPAERAFSAALASIDAAFQVSQDIGRTRDALRTFVDMTAAEVRA
jgi:hypothetical protein